MCKCATLGQKVNFKLLSELFFVEGHLLSNLTRIGQTHNICVTFHAEHMRILPMILQGRLSNSDILSLSKPFVLLVEDLGMPNLIRTIQQSDLRGVVIKLYFLQHLALEVKVVVFFVCLDLI